MKRRVDAAISLPKGREKDEKDEDQKGNEVVVTIRKERLRCIWWKVDNDGAFVTRVDDTGPVCDVGFDDRLTHINEYQVDGMPKQVIKAVMRQVQREGQRGLITLTVRRPLYPQSVALRNRNMRRRADPLYQESTASRKQKGRNPTPSICG